MSDLLGKSTVKRRKAAIALRIKADVTKAEKKELYEALVLEENTNNWQTKLELLKSVGVLNVREASKYIYDTYIEYGDDRDIVVMASATAYVRLTRKNNKDLSVALALINKNNYSITEGVLEAIGYDKMSSSIETQNEIIEKCFDFGKDRGDGYTDPRYGLAAACAGWKSSKVPLFLNECLNSGDAPLEYVAKNSLKGKYVKLR
ncbi:hypothetical protein [Christiangramia sp. SM2212]|uniref:Uncharacterized protein n=1 Tax=Christiangramia sediminicola TaxID=3073267 RepID=A0ABU1ETE6_9FLAO|nr:hypothetical protein [Christiangramia sp. SM2212]MDR5591674.1 hypothetical protein [Christiangramia sp. SM2212]